MTPLEQAIARLEELGKYGFRPPTQYIQVTDSLAWVRQDLELVLRTPTVDEVIKALSEYTKRKIQFENGYFQEQLDSGNWYLLNLNYIIEDKRYDLISLIGRFYEWLEVKE